MTTIIDSFLAKKWAGAALTGGCVVLGLVAISFSQLAGIFILVITGLMATGIFLSRRAGARLPEAPGRLFGVDGVRMHIVAEGEAGSNFPVIWVAGGHGEGLLMHHLHSGIKAETRSILFDRMGSGWSEPGKLPMTISREVDQLNKLLVAAGESGPFVLVGHSFGGLFSLNFAHHYPDRVAGLVLLDPTPPWNVAFAGSLSFAETLRKSRWRALAGHFGLAALVEPEIDDADSAYCQALAPHAAVINAHSVQPKSLIAEASAFRAAMAGPLDMVIGAGALNDTPLLLLSENPTEEMQTEMSNTIRKEFGLTDLQIENLWAGLEQSVEAQVQLSSRGERRMTPVGSSHMFPYEEPEFVLAAVREMFSSPHVA